MAPAMNHGSVTARKVGVESSATKAGSVLNILNYLKSQHLNAIKRLFYNELQKSK